MDFIDTADRDEAVDVLRRTFPGIDILDDSDQGEFRFRYRRVDRDCLTQTRLAVTGTVRTPGTYPDHIAVGRRRRGAVRVWYGNLELDTTRPYIRAPGHSVAEFSGSDVELIIFERSTFVQHALRVLEGSGRSLRGPDPARANPVSAAGSRLWNATADVLDSHVFARSAPITRPLYEELAVAALLAAFPLAVDRTEPAGVEMLPRAVRRATEYVDAHAASPITVGMIADAARVPVRTLQAGFRRHLGTTPAHYVRNVRLRLVREELIQAHAGEDSVSAIARRWGFVHLGRFAAQYFAEYGEHPSQTLGR
ncbi:helix-turn-helix transcriptional regulator [Agromyces sp. NPDC058110]|uniref:helix-turn-helix transcriptional regulator n=1 Tax=Agromyces sp. NPDC058110 TaxID=3346345 RepID=UPI0036DC2CE3